MTIKEYSKSLSFAVANERLRKESDALFKATATD
jgi:hypothetical protein